MPGRPANCAGSDRAERRERPRRDEHAGSAAGRRDDQALGQHLLHERARVTRRRRVRIDSSFWRPAARASSSVATFAQAISSTKRDRAEQHEQRRLHVADERVAQRPQVRRVIRVLGRKLLRQPRADDPQILARLFRRHAVAQPADHLEEMRGAQRAIVIVERQRHDDVGLRRPPETRRQHADDLERSAVERDGAADDRRIGAEAAPPQRRR